MNDLLIKPFLHYEIGNKLIFVYNLMRRIHATFVQ